LLLLLHDRPDISCHVIHLNHKTRGEASDGDAAFVHDLATRMGIDQTIMTRTQMEPQMPNLPANPSARYRELRLALFQQVVERERLQGVVLAHHADDQAETILHRLLRGSGGCAGLGGMKEHVILGGLHVYRPLLSVSRRVLRDFLAQQQQTWREDASNQFSTYARNRLRKVLSRHPHLIPALISLGSACAPWQAWIRANAPRLGETFAVDDLCDQATCLAEASARQWLIDRGAPPVELSPAVIARLLTLARDAASPSREQFPGNIHVRRRRGHIEMMSLADGSAGSGRS
jgi:tRNA(Ile)-lysidine synthetase-like protein